MVVGELTTPTCWRPTTSPRHAAQSEALQRRPREADAQPGRTPSASSPARRSRWSPPRPASSAAASPPTSPTTRSPTATSRPAAARPIPNFGGSTLRRHAVRDPAERRATRRSPRWASTPAATPSTTIGQGFGFDQDMPFDLPGGVQSTFPEAMVDDPPTLAQASIGQNDVQATPLQMALVAACRRQRRGDHGAPRHDARSATTRATRSTSSTTTSSSQPMSPDTAGLLRDAMVSVVTDGTAEPARRRPRRLRGRRQDRHGPARHRPDPSRTRGSSASPGPPGETPHIAVAVIVEAQPGASEQTGGRVAAPIAAG